MRGESTELGNGFESCLVTLLLEGVVRTEGPMWTEFEFFRPASVSPSGKRSLVFLWGVTFSTPSICEDCLALTSHLAPVFQKLGGEGERLLTPCCSQFVLATPA